MNMEAMTNGGRLTAKDRKALRAPFAATAVKWLPIGKAGASGVNVQPHINASLVFERLGDVDPSWEVLAVVPEIGRIKDPRGFEYDGYPEAQWAAAGHPHRAWLLVNGVIRSGRGTTSPTEPSKSVESDAIKRAALAYEIGAYLRALDMVWLPKQGPAGELFKTRDYQGKTSFSGLTKAGKAHLRAHYERIVTHKLFIERYGAAVEYGDVAAGDDERDDEPVMPAPDAPNADGPDDQELAVLLALAAHNGRSTPDDVLAEALGSSTFAKVLPRVLNGVVAHLELGGEDAEKLRAQSIAVAGGTGLVTELVDALAAVAAQASAGEPEQGTMPV